MAPQGCGAWQRNGNPDPSEAWRTATQGPAAGDPGKERHDHRGDGPSHAALICGILLRRPSMRRALLSVAVVFSLLVDPAACLAQAPEDLPAGKKLIALEGRLWQARWS